MSFLRLSVWGNPRGKVKTVWKSAFLFLFVLFLPGNSCENCREQEDINKSDWERVCEEIENTQVKQGSH